MFKTNKNDIFAKPMSGQELHATTKLAVEENQKSVNQEIINEKRFRKADHKPLIEYINWSELVEDFNLKTGDLDYSEFNKLEVILANYIEINK